MQQPVQNLESKIKELWPKDGPSSLEVEKYIKKYSKEKIVIKCGGKVLLDQSLLNNLIEDIVILKKLGLTPILVHGGGLGIKKKLDEQNIQSKFVMGLRVTDDKMIGIVEDVMINFNKKIVKALKAVSSIPIVYYISPQVWAWKENRVSIIKQQVDSLIVLFPFEKSWFKKRGVEVQYFGHPLIDLYHKQSTQTIGPANDIVGFFPGSRLQEIKKHTPVLLKIYYN